MVLLQSTALSPLHSPDNLTVPQFLLDDGYSHATRPKRNLDTPCIIDDETGQKVFIDELRGRIQGLATAIHVHMGMNEGDVATILSHNHRDYPVCIWAIHRLGGIVATMNPSLTTSELVYQFKVARPSICFTHVDYLPILRPAAALMKLPPDRIIVLDGPTSQEAAHCRSLNELIRQGIDLPHFISRRLFDGEAEKKIAFLAFSSGTTGKPKAVAITHYNVINIVIQSATFNRINEPYTSWSDRRFRPGDVCGGFLPLHHIYGLVFNLHFMLYAGMSLLIAPKFKFEKFLSSIERYRITHLTIVPSQAVLLCKHAAVRKHDMSSVRYCIVAAAPLSALVTKKLLDVFPSVHLGQGMTETCGTVSMFPLSQKVGTLGSGGKLLPGTSAKVVKADGTIAKAGEPGELYVRGGQITPGYYQDEKSTNEIFIDGWLKTGDQVIFQDDEIFVVDRIKEMIKVKGIQVAPAELEGHLLDHAGVADAAVVGIPDEYAGELPLAFIVLQPEVASAVQHDPNLANQVRSSIFEHVSNAKSKHKWLTGGILFTDSIPKNASGKILRRLLRDFARTRMDPHVKL